MAIDAAANYSRESEGYVIGGRLVLTTDLETLPEAWCEAYPPRSIEEPFNEDDLRVLKAVDGSDW